MCIFRCLVANQCLCLWYYSTCFLFKMVQDFLVPTIPKSGLAAFRCCLHPAIQPLRRGFVVGPHCYPTASKWCRVLYLATPFLFSSHFPHTFCLMTIFLSWLIIISVCFTCSCSNFSTEHFQTSKYGLKSFGLLGHFGVGWFVVVQFSPPIEKYQMWAFRWLFQYCIITWVFIQTQIRWNFSRDFTFEGRKEGISMPDLLVGHLWHCVAIFQRSFEFSLKTSNIAIRALQGCGWRSHDRQ